jgi:hypothetical protein
LTKGQGRIGFSQRVPLPWLERTANLQMSGLPKSEIEAALQEFLRPRVSIGGNATRGNREKVTTILLRSWVTVPKELRSFRDEGLDHLRELPVEQHLPIHWGIIMASYPFWGLVAETVGRLLRLQRSAGATQVQRRLREQLGERETVARAARRVLRSFVDWGVLTETEEKGVYGPATPRSIRRSELAVWLFEATLRAAGSNTASLKLLGQAPALFPFAMEPVTSRSLAGHPRLELARQAADEDVVLLRGSRTLQPKRDPGNAHKERRGL